MSLAIEPSASASSDDLTRRLDGAALSSYHWRIFALCGLVAVMDGFDSVIIGITAPSLAHALSLEISAFGPIFAAAQFGFMVGAFASGPAADRWGRKLMLALSALLFACATMATVEVNSFTELFFVRLITGIGLGGGATNFLALCSDFAPARIRATILAVLWAMIPAGNVVGGLISAAVLPAYGWQPLYLFGGIVPAIAAFAILFFVPESIRFLSRDPSRATTVNGILQKLGVEPVDPLVFARSKASAEQSAPVRALFRNGNARITAWLWLCAFMCWLMLLTLLSWMAPLMQQLGVPTASASLAVASNSSGAIVGALMLGRLMDKYDGYLICAVSIMAGALATAVTGIVAVNFAALAGMAFVLGFTVGGASAGVMAIIATIYPDDLRSTGVGWSIGVARIGSAAGPILAGLLLQWGASAAQIFGMLALPCIVAAVALLRLRAIMRTAAKAG